jgi:ribosomal protein S12 methylthiotransferase
MGAFSYSDEDTSRSFALDAKVDGRTIQNRKRKLMAIQRKISRSRNRTLVGHELDVLIEGPSADSELVWQARLSTQAPDIDGVCYISDPGEAPLRAGEFRRMRITKAHDYDLTGELVGTATVPTASNALIMIS